MSHLLIIDGKYLAHVALYSRRWLSLKGKPIGVVYGWWADVLSSIQNLQPTHVTIAWDSRELFREDVYPEYKKNQQHPKDMIKEIEDFYPQIEQIEDIVSEVGIAQDKVGGLEADDLIALHCRRFQGQVTIYSSDNDLYQLLTPKVSLYNKKKFFTVKDFQKTHDCTPDEWLLIKALAGCPGDNVGGIKGIAVKTATKILKGQHKKTLSDFQEIIDRNLQLVQLPYPLISYKNIQLNVSDQIDWERLKEWFIRLEFYSLLKKLKSA